MEKTVFSQDSILCEKQKTDDNSEWLSSPLGDEDL